MKKIPVILTSFLLVVALTTFYPHHFNIDLKLFNIKKIDVKNVQILDKKEITNLLYNELSNSNLLILNKKKLDKVFNDYKLINYIELKKIFPSKLQITIYEKKTIAIINDKQRTSYLVDSGEEIDYFKNSKLEKLPNIFGKQKNFLKIYSALQQLSFPISEIKSFYYFEIGRWDIILKNNKVIKLPITNFNESLKNYMELKKNINFEKYSIFDYRIENQLILN